MPPAPDVDLHFTPGVIRVASHYRVVKHHDVLVWEVDLFSKHPEVDQATEFTRDGDVHVIFLRAGVRSVMINESMPAATRFTFSNPRNENWTVVAKVDGHLLVIVAYRHPPFEGGHRG